MNLEKRAKLLRQALIQRVTDAGHRKVAIPMSAGVDSHCALFAALEARAKPHVYSFHLEGVNSRDFRMAQKTASHFDLPFTEIVLPSDIKTLIHDVKRLAKFGTRSKTDFECFWPMIYLIPHIKQKVMFTGHGADSLYCLSRKANQHFKGREDEFRRLAFSNKKAFQRHLITKLCSKYEIDYVPSFYCDAVFKLFEGTTQSDINKPIQKAVSRSAFPEYFEQIQVYTHTSFQLGDSGIAKHFESLLKTELNPDLKYKSTRGLYGSVCSKFSNKKL